MSKYYIGVMSGTSLDGIDVAAVQIDWKDKEIITTIGTQQIPKLNIKLIAGMTYDFDKKLKHRLKDLIEQKSSNLLEEICQLNYLLGITIGQCVNRFLGEAKIKKEEVELIASHGQTIYHSAHSDFTSTLQIGDGSIISALTGLPVIYNFRQADIAAGGQGAPLVPFVDFILFKNNSVNRSIHNIGGISNMTVIPKDDTLPFAFDTGPGNMVIDECIRRLYGKEYDQEGEIARSGIIQDTFLKEFMNHDYLKKHPPKTTGRELFGSDYTHYVLDRMECCKSEDIIATVTALTAHSISEAYKNFVLPCVEIEEIIFGGGGANNKYLIRSVHDLLCSIKINRHTDYEIDNKFKEALAFAVLGFTNIKNVQNNLAMCTGARYSIILGQRCGV